RNVMRALQTMARSLRATGQPSFSPNSPRVQRDDVAPTCEFGPRTARPDRTGDELAVEVERGFLAGMLRMKVRWFVFLVVHPDHDSEKRGDDRHTSEDFEAV